VDIDTKICERITNQERYKHGKSPTGLVCMHLISVSVVQKSCMFLGATGNLKFPQNVPQISDLNYASFCKFKEGFRREQRHGSFI